MPQVVLQHSFPVKARFNVLYKTDVSTVSVPEQLLVTVLLFSALSLWLCAFLYEARFPRALLLASCSQCMRCAHCLLTCWLPAANACSTQRLRLLKCCSRGQDRARLSWLQVHRLLHSPLSRQGLSSYTAHSTQVLLVVFSS